ncbi:MAG: PorV/PorQ family protein [candidate division KSB1 bacterium]|nr:PorV/PorQ family protein [candidate division KSB1 bacterium]MDQ7065223.1 PorV/PorQ family protein [candidate division KSB1 bacterium]
MSKFKNIISFLVFASVVVAAVHVEAGNPKRRGTSGAQELLIPVGSRGTAMGGAVVSSTSGIDAIFWNPAGLAGIDAGAQLMASNLQYIADISVNYAAVAGNFRGVGWFGFSIKTLDFGEIPVTTEDNPDGTGATFSPTFLTLGVTYARAMTDRILFGATVKVVSEEITRERATGVAFDFGLQYSTGPGGLRLGVALKNLGGNMKFDGPDLEEKVNIPGQRVGSQVRNLRVPLNPFELPTTLELGVSYEWKVNETNSLTFSGSFLNDNFGLDLYSGGVEYNMNNMVFLRGGFAAAYDVEQATFQTQSEEFLFGPSFGAGVQYEITSGIKLAIDYAYRTTQYFDNNQWLTLTVTF